MVIFLSRSMYLSFLYLYAIVIQTQKQPESVDLEQAQSGLMSIAPQEWIWIMQRGSWNGFRKGQPELSEKKIAMDCA